MNKMRWRYGNTNPLSSPTGKVPIHIGDLVYVDNSFLYPASAGDASFHWCKKFLGVAMQFSTKASEKIKVATSGVFEFDCLEEAAEGDYVTAAYVYQLDQVFVRSQQVCVCSEEYAVGRVVKGTYQRGSLSYVLVTIMPQIHNLVPGLFTRLT